jgi:hypothetical protein
MQVLVIKMPNALPEAFVVTEIDAARVGDHRDAHLAFGWWASCHLFQKLDPGFTQRFGVGHDMRLGHRHQVGRIEKFSDPLHMLDRPAARFAELTIQHGRFFVVQFHLGQSFSESVDAISASV